MLSATYKLILNKINLMVILMKLEHKTAQTKIFVPYDTNKHNNVKSSNLPEQFHCMQDPKYPANWIHSQKS